MQSNNKGPNLHERFLRTKRLIEKRRTSASEGQLEEIVISRQLIDSDMLMEEKLLEDTKFIQYRYMTPFQATEEFAREFDKHWRFWMRRLGIHCARPTTPLAMMRNRIISSMWRARQVADAIGMPYGVFIASGMEYMAQESGKKLLPMPNQLCSTEQVERAIKVWNDPGERSAVELFGPHWDARFFVENYADDPVQIAAFDVMDQRIQDAGLKGLVRAHYLGGFIGRTMSEEQARCRHGDSMVDDAMAFLASLGGHKARPAPEPVQQYVRNCFGYAFEAGSEKCDKCPFAVGCDARMGASKRVLIDRTGSDDPRAAKIREANKRRQSAYRKRKREEAGMLASGPAKVPSELSPPSI